MGFAIPKALVKMIDIRECAHNALGSDYAAEVFPFKDELEAVMHCEDKSALGAMRSVLVEMGKLSVVRVAKYEDDSVYALTICAGLDLAERDSGMEESVATDKVFEMWDDEYDAEEDDREWWCTSHRRDATATDKDGKPCCDPAMGGICIPCHAIVKETGGVEL